MWVLLGGIGAIIKAIPPWGYNFGVGAGVTLTNGNSIQDISATFNNTTYALGPVTIDYAVGANGIFSINRSLLATKLRLGVEIVNGVVRP
jgi:hypothetical protein